MAMSSTLLADAVMRERRGNETKEQRAAQRALAWSGNTNRAHEDPYEKRCLGYGDGGRS